MRITSLTVSFLLTLAPASVLVAATNSTTNSTATDDDESEGASLCPTPHRQPCPGTPFAVLRDPDNNCQFFACPPAHEGWTESTTGTGTGTGTADNIQGDGTSSEAVQALACIECTNNPTQNMINRGTDCDTAINALVSRCFEDPAWVAGTICQSSCYFAVRGYDGDVCCGEFELEDGTDAPTSAATTESPTDMPTDVDTDDPTSSPTDMPVVVTDAPTTESPVADPTSVPTDTDAPTSSPAAAATDAPVTTPTSSPVQSSTGNATDDAGDATDAGNTADTGNATDTGNTTDPSSGSATKQESGAASCDTESGERWCDSLQVCHYEWEVACPTSATCTSDDNCRVWLGGCGPYGCTCVPLGADEATPTECNPDTNAEPPCVCAGCVPGTCQGVVAACINGTCGLAVVESSPAGMTVVVPVPVEPTAMPVIASMPENGTAPTDMPTDVQEEPTEAPDAPPTAMPVALTDSSTAATTTSNSTEQEVPTMAPAEASDAAATPTSAPVPAPTSEPSSTPSSTPTEEIIFCTQDALDCGNDVFVSRDPENDCQFPPCPSTPTTLPTTLPEGTTYTCEEGFSGLYPANSCEGFIWCTDGNYIAGPNLCPSTTLFDRSCQCCNNADQVVCTESAGRALKQEEKKQKQSFLRKGGK